MSPRYRFYTADLLTGAMLGDIPLQGVTADMTLTGEGNLDGNFPLGQQQDTLRLSTTLPGRTALYSVRNDELIWGGIIWNRQFVNQQRNIELVCKTFDSFYERTVLEKNYVKQAVEQVTCFTSLVSAVNAQSGSNIGITCPSITATGVPRTILLPAYEFHYANEVIDELLDAIDGLEYTVEVADSGTPDHPTKTIRLGSVGSLNAAQIIYLDAPGNITDYTWPENAMQGGNKFAGRGAGSGNQAATAVATDQTSLSAGYPALWDVTNYPDVADKAIIKSKTQRQIKRDKVPYTAPRFTVKGDAMTGIWQKLGATIDFTLNDVRFPNGLHDTRRMYGWSLTYQQGDTQEQLVLDTDNGATA